MKKEENNGAKHFKNLHHLPPLDVVDPHFVSMLVKDSPYWSKKVGKSGA